MLRPRIRIHHLAVGLTLFPVLLVPQAALAAAGGSFGSTGSMGAERGEPAAAPLGNGRVLVAGGYGSGSDLSSADVFEPLVNSFLAGIGSATRPREFAAAAPLSDGRALVAGGFNLGGYQSSAEVFDPATNTFSSAGIGEMGTARQGDAAAPLPDGRVLVAGGFNAGGYQSSAEVFDPATNTFSSAGIGEMGTARESPVAAPLPDGRVLIAGGYDGSSFLSSAEVFNPATNTFSSAGIGAMGAVRFAAAAAPLPDGRVLVAGGSPDGSAALASAEVFDPATNTFSSAGIGAMGTARQGDAAAPLPDGRVLVAGGYDGSSFLSSAEIFSLANPSTAISPTVKRQRLFATVAVAGTVQIADAAIGNLKRKLKPVRVSGGPGQISVRLRLTRLAGRRLRKKGKVKVWARISFTPTRHVGECVSAFAQCYSSRFADTETMRLTLTGRRHKRTRRG